MNVIDWGKGVPVVVIPGIQGRWEWHIEGLEALAGQCRVLTLSYADEPGAGASFDPRSCIDSYCDQIRAAIAQAGLPAVALCGISYGGLVAAVFTARHPEMVSSLILASALPPTWTPDARARFFLRAPRMLMPLFLLGSLRLFKEILRASPGIGAAVVIGVRHAWNALTHMFSPTRMARRAAQLEGPALQTAVSTITTPTLVIVGERDLDRVVPVEATLDYVRLLPHAKVATLERTGHLGSVTRPEVFAGLVASFARQYASRT